MSVTYTKFNDGWKKIEVYPHSELTIKPRPVMGVEEIVKGWNIEIVIRHRDREECWDLRSGYLSEYPTCGYATILSEVEYDGYYWVCSGSRYSNCN